MCLHILCHVASTCHACLPPLFAAAADGSPPNPNTEFDLDWPGGEEKIAMARIAVAQHNAAKNDSLQAIRLVWVEREGNWSAGDWSSHEEYRLSLTALSLLRGRTASFNALAGSEHASTEEEQEIALRHVVQRPTDACGDELTFVDLSGEDVQRVARGAVASENERQTHYTCLLPCSLPAPLPPTGQRSAVHLGAGSGFSMRSLALFALGEPNRQDNDFSYLTLLDVLAARANVVEGTGINYSVTVTAAAHAAPIMFQSVPGGDDKAAGVGKRKEVATVKVLVWQPVPFTAHRLLDLFVLGDTANNDCASPPPGYILLGNCMAVPKAGCYVAAPIGFVTVAGMLVSLGLVIALL
ncbi:unnamed protein product [Closterium sp. Naga37s-1]|nr:unnamed protein product [Closterium sp. Naga37s-1]